jgi:hypothetical protein
LPHIAIIASSLLTHFLVPSGAYYHKHFVRGDHHLARQMVRNTEKAKPSPVAASASGSSCIDHVPITLDMLFKENEPADYERPKISSISSLHAKWFSADE